MRSRRAIKRHRAAAQLHVGRQRKVTALRETRSKKYGMPLFTFVVSYKGASYVAQSSHSNFTGFAMSWAANIPESELSVLTPFLRKELTRKAYGGSFVAVQSVKHVWWKSIEVGGSELSVHVVQTER